MSAPHRFAEPVAQNVEFARLRSAGAWVKRRKLDSLCYMRGRPGRQPEAFYWTAQLLSQGGYWRAMIFDQAEYNVRCEWGREGASALAPVSDVVIVVDVLSFSTAVEIAASRGAAVYPYRFKDEAAREFAASVGAEVADGRNDAGHSLSPASLLGVAAGLRLVLPSLNGAEVSLATGRTPTLAGCFRNSRAVAAAALRRGDRVAVIPAGERWPGGALRPCFEDLAGAGAVIRHLRGTWSPEARAAVSVFESARAELLGRLKACGSGKEKIARGEAEDVLLAAALDVSDCAPALGDGAFRGEAGGVVIRGDG